MVYLLVLPPQQAPDLLQLSQELQQSISFRDSFANASVYSGYTC